LLPHWTQPPLTLLRKTLASMLLLPVSVLAQVQSGEVKPVDVFSITYMNPVPQSPEYRAYVKTLIDKVSGTMRLLNRPEKRISVKGVSVVGFQLGKDGSITADTLKVLASSGSSDLNDLALSSIQSSLPLEAFPKSVTAERIDVRMMFRFAVLPDAPFRTLYDSAQRAVSNKDYSTAAQVLESLLGQNPDYTNGWNYLGWIYNQLGYFDKAVPALQKAISANPFDGFAYNNLGLAFAGQKKYEEAIAQFQKQIEISPKDRFAYTNLGRAYLALHQPEKAVPTLETAVSIVPNDPTAHFNLGRASAESHDKDKALKSFQRSVEIEPVPQRWNAVAYQLALNEIGLEQGLAYINSAIGAAAGRLREVSADSLSNDDLRNTNALASYWDTYGWIRFKQGNLPEAEKYVRCAWTVHNIGEDADHLAQIYEKQGRKDDATRLYALALASSSSPSAETRGRLAPLLGGDTAVDSLVEKMRPQLTALRTVQLENPQDLDGIAEFWILFAPGKRVVAAKFINGDEAIRPLAKDLTSASFPEFFPEATEIRLVRRGRVSCVRKPVSLCNLLLASAETVRSID
jgi:tetratricopeptide (TPR) repeat protein